MGAVNRPWQLAAALLLGLASQRAGAVPYDLVIRGGTIYDGGGGEAFVGDIAVSGDRIVFIGPQAPGTGRLELRADGLAVAPGFINMLSWANESLLVDGRALSDIRQGVTLEVLGEGQSMGPLTPAMRHAMQHGQSNLRYSVDWTTLGQYLQELEARGVAPNVASFVGAATVRMHELGNGAAEPTPRQLSAMRQLVRQSMEEGALGLSTALIYAPGAYAKTAEITALAEQAARCGGIYISHMRSEGDRLLEAIDETVGIATASGGRAEIYHFKAAGQANWGKLDQAVARIEAARARGIRIGADMYTYTASYTALDAILPLWAHQGGRGAMLRRLRDPIARGRVIAEISGAASTIGLSRKLDPEGTLLLGFKSEKLKSLIGKTLAQMAEERGLSGAETAVELITEDGGASVAAYFLMSEDKVREEVALPWITFGSDAAAPAPEGVFLRSNVHPRAYGNFARLLGRYVRDEQVVPLSQAIRRLTALPAARLSLEDRGMLRQGYFADVVVFNPGMILDQATYAAPHQLAIGVRDLLVNGRFALRDGLSTGAASGRFVRGRAWTGRPNGGCRAAARDWNWSAD